MSVSQEQPKRLKTDPDMETDTKPADDKADDDAEDISDERRKLRVQLAQRWMEKLPYWYPELLTKTYFIPSFHANKMDLQPLPSSSSLSSSLLSTLKSQAKTKNSDFRDDMAQLTVNRVFWDLAKQRHEEDVMAVLTNFSLDNYLNKRLSGAPGGKKKRKRKGKAKQALDTEPEDPQVKTLFPRLPTTMNRGEFDVLIVHKDLGFLIIEIKAIGDIQETEVPGLDTLDNLLGKQELRDLLVQLNRGELQLQMMTSDLQSAQIPVTKIAAFPNVTRQKLREVMANPDYSKVLNDELTKYLGSDVDLDNALKFWLCQDEIQGTVTSEGEKDDVTMTWWNGMLNRMEEVVGKGEFCGMDDDVYKQLVARLCGPMSTVQVFRRGRQIHEARDVGDATYVMSKLCQQWILRPEQRDWYRCSDPFVYLTGPPGSGKTLLLVVNAVHRVQECNTMAVVVRGPGNLPGHLISQLLHSQITAALQGTGEQEEEKEEKRVLLQTINARTDPKDFVNRMKQKAKALGRSVMFLVDELWLSNPSKKMVALLREMVGLLDTCRQDVELLSSGNAAASAGAAGTQSDSAAAADNAAPSSDVGSRMMLETLTAIKVGMGDIHESPDIAKALLKDEDLTEEKRKLLSGVEKLQETLTAKGQTHRAEVSAQALEKVQDVRFYTGVLLSWMTSPVLHAVMQEARRHDDVSLWCTGFWPNRCPEGYQTAQFPESIRCPCHIQEVLDKTELLASHQKEKQYDYHGTSTQHKRLPLAAEAPASSMVTPIDHGLHVQHGALSCVSRCAQCAEQLATLLYDTFHVGTGSNLSFSDVLVVSRATMPIKPDSPFVQTLTKREVPVSVVVNGSDDIPPYGLDENKVLITNTYNGHGLERSIVVFVPDIKHCKPRGEGGGGDGGGDYMKGLGEFNEMGLWFIASRSLGHLVVFHV